MATLTSSEQALLFKSLSKLRDVHIAMTLTQLERIRGSRLSEAERKVLLDAINRHHRSILDLLGLRYNA